MLGQHVQSDVLCEGQLGSRLWFWRPLSRHDTRRLVPLDLEVTLAVGRLRRVIEVGEHLYIVTQPAGAPPALTLNWVLTDFQRVGSDDSYI